ncbi:conserved hypothetical protein [Cytophaga hutchinsonii ATCC 33406]|uniref:DUF3108 domain-containing protein n=2 Tax=Cytophaga hutchinsonii TaxID=985 RepID=A0A6N4SVU5_CYTH3|nr:conserved hypothetical protein [Cytophaga hutchinsonii ATCC 33406]SFX89555.1 hypothetical protein SAMN04487930_11248 [Cytophaga hutchinsonii ATCC 33406]
MRAGILPALFLFIYSSFHPSPMKKILSVCICICSICYLVKAQQQCENVLYTFKEGATHEFSDYNKKGKQAGHTTFILSDISAGDSVLTGQLKKTSYDEKDKQLASADLTLKCRNGEALIDMESVVSEKQLESYRNGEFRIINQDLLLFPNVLEVGAKLNNGKLSAELDSDGTKVGKLLYEITERLVQAKESVTVPAGTFDCYKISTKVHSITTIAGVNLNYDYVLIEWYAYGIGLVRSETYKKGTLETYSTLTKLSK